MLLEPWSLAMLRPAKVRTTNFTNHGFVTQFSFFLLVEDSRFWCVGKQWFFGTRGEVKNCIRKKLRQAQAMLKAHIRDDDH